MERNLRRRGKGYQKRSFYAKKGDEDYDPNEAPRGQFSTVKVWKQVVPWVINDYFLLHQEDPGVAPGYAIDWKVINLWGYNKIGIREMNSDLIFYVRNPIEGKWYHYGVIFRPIETSVMNPDNTHWDGWYLTYQYTADGYDSTFPLSTELWLPQTPNVTADGTINLQRDANTYPNSPVLDGYSMNECIDQENGDRECRFFSHVIRTFQTFDPEDYQLANEYNQEYEAIAFYYIYDDEAGTIPYNPPNGQMTGIPGAQSLINSVMLGATVMGCKLLMLTMIVFMSLFMV